MKKYLFIFWVGSFFFIPQSKAEGLDSIWNTYTSNSPAQLLVAKNVKEENASQTNYGRMVGQFSQQTQLLFKDSWEYRAITYELHYENNQDLNSMIYGLALHAGDIDASLSYDKFTKGVLGFHYSIDQICDWINDAWNAKAPQLTSKEYALLGFLLQDGIIIFDNQKFLPSGIAKHILGASPGKKKSMEKILQHERLHVFWDEDAEFRAQSIADWNALSSEERAEERKKLSRYAKDNESQLIEEWAVHKQID